VCAAEAARPLSAAEAARLFEPLANASALVLAVSGGPDSTALLLLAARWRARRSVRRAAPKLLAVTVDHGLRPQSAREARAVKQLARTLAVPHRVLRWQGRKPHTGLQEAARAARYRLLGRAARRAGAGYVVTAHTLDDQAETLLMRLLRGSGMAGLAAMRRIAPLPLEHVQEQWQPVLRKSTNKIVRLARPFLDIPKARLVATLRRAGIAFFEDASNRDPCFTRARLRELMPMLAREGLGAQRIALLARRIARAELALEHAVEVAAADLIDPQSANRLRSRICAPGTAGPIALDAERLFALPAEIGLRLLGCAITHIGREGSLQLGKLEALYDDLSAEAGMRLRRTLAGALVTLDAGKLLVERAPPRSSTSARSAKKKAVSLGRRSAGT
jgi:tRNA(Ile)-lysidine synthase